jgi:phospholipase C
MSAAIPESFQRIQRFVVVMLENRSFDHLVGYMKRNNPAIAGITGNEFNYLDPNAPTTPIKVGKATSFAVPFDPGHEFIDVQVQLYGPKKNPPPASNPLIDPAPMSGFVYNAKRAAETPADASRVMQCFEPEQVQVLSTLIQEFAVFNFWHSSLPGPTWPNRFFVHAATSGGFTDSPDKEQTMRGFKFENGTIYDRLEKAGKDWRIYHDGLPQAAGIDRLRLEYIDLLTKHFREMKYFQDDVKSGLLPQYTFIEPYYDTGHNFQGGNSMHPLNDVRKGEELLKEVYETLRNSTYWAETMVVVTFDEHGAFYDHVPPPSTIPTGDDKRYANPTDPFAFDRLGVRVPAIVVSAYTQRGTVIGVTPKDNANVFDHSSILATVEKRFGLSPLTKRDALANTLDIALNLTVPRVSPEDAPTRLPNPVTDTLWTKVLSYFRKKPAAALDNAPLSKNQEAHLALALACDIQDSRPEQHQALHSRHSKIRTPKDVAEYMREIESRLHSRRKWQSGKK